MSEIKLPNLEDLKMLAVRLGYRFVQTETDSEIVEQMIRPDGSIAVTARKLKHIVRND